MEIRKFDNGSYIIADTLSIGSNFRIGPNTTIRATACVIGDNVTLGANNMFLVGQELRIGNLTIIGNANSFTARTIHIGEYVYWDSNVVVGHGGKFSEDAHLRVGSYSMICARITLNVNHAIHIGEYVGIGEDVAVWTHGSYLPVLDGFPADFGPVHIGNNVWLPAKSTVLPNRRIGNNVVIGTNSLINKDLPDGCLAGGIPVRIIRENMYPSHDPARNEQLVRRIVDDYAKLAAYKELAVHIAYDPTMAELRCNDVIFHLDTMKAEGAFTAVEEDFRDFLRRRGIKFYTGQPFSSILPEEYRRLLAFSPDADGVQ
jgi:acetyltransferase-like isoleucine patch superfamily enzyme